MGSSGSSMVRWLSTLLYTRGWSAGSTTSIRLGSNWPLGESSFARNDGRAVVARMFTDEYGGAGHGYSCLVDDGWLEGAHARNQCSTEAVRGP